MTMVLPEETRHHLRAACKENLLAIRALLDVLIGEVEPAPRPCPLRAGGQAASAPQASSAAAGRTAAGGRIGDRHE